MILIGSSIWTAPLIIMIPDNAANQKRRRSLHLSIFDGIFQRPLSAFLRSLLKVFDEGLAALLWRVGSQATGRGDHWLYIFRICIRMGRAYFPNPSWQNFIPNRLCIDAEQSLVAIGVT